MPLLQNLKLCCWISRCKDKRREGHWRSCKFCSYSISCHLYLWMYNCLFMKNFALIQEEQMVIEAQIRIRQQEIQDEAKRLKKRQELSSSRRMMNSDYEIQDEVKRLKKRKDVCLSSRIVNPTEAYSDIPSTSNSGPSPIEMLFYTIKFDIYSWLVINNADNMFFCNVWKITVPSSKCSACTTDIVSSQASCSMPAGMLPSHPKNRYKVQLL